MTGVEGVVGASADMVMIATSVEVVPWAAMQRHENMRADGGPEGICMGRGVGCV